jgi:hypothetical protein
MATKLYRVRSTKSDGTEFVWIAFRKEPPVRCDELFTHDEAEQLIDYLASTTTT